MSAPPNVTVPKKKKKSMWEKTITQSGQYSSVCLKVGLDPLQRIPSAVQ